MLGSVSAGVLQVLPLGLLDAARLNDEIVDVLPCLPVLHLLLVEADLRRGEERGENFAFC